MAPQLSESRRGRFPFWGPIAILALAGLAALSPPTSDAAEDEEETVIRIERIEIEGAKGREEAIKSQLRIREGESYSAEAFHKVLNMDTKHLFRWGIFVKRIRPKHPKGNTILVLEVEERLRIASIRFEGMGAFEDEEILQLLIVKAGSPTDDALLRLAADQMKEYYRDDGYRFADVDFELKDQGQGRAVLVFQVREGPRTRIVDIEFRGNRSVRPRKLRSIMETKKSDLFQAERLEDEKFRRDLAALEQYYREEGWRDASVTLEDLVYSDDRERLTVKILVSEGERYVVDSLEIQGNKEIPAEILRRKIRLRPGMYYRASLIYGNVADEERGDFRNIRDAYGEKGFLFPVLQADEVFDEKNKKVKVTYRIEEGKRIRIRRVLIRGNEKTRDDVIRRHLVIRPGEIPRGSEIEATYKRIYQTQFFSKVNLRYLDTGDPEEKDLLFEVEETRTGDIRFIAAYNQSTQFMGKIAVRFKNFDIGRFPRSLSDFLSGRAFAGGGQTLTVQLTAGGDKQLIYNVKFEEPFFFGTRTYFMLNLFRSQRDWGPYLERRLAAHFMFGRRLAPFLSASLRYRVEGLELRDISLYAPPDVWAAAGPDTISGLMGTLTLDMVERNNFRVPYSGVTA
ncbi:MAG: outer membrane protein assembly factor BamA, partial [Planctomycetota bacterium]